ncbi:MAG TPA: o-succinylbenzoate synthase, partial [Chloroflexia bacterium]|nr:o-succinylbenzoate synthase [Chloroflexia bacterium]
VTPFETSFGRDTVREALIVELRGAAGSGWGQTVAFETPGYSYETLDTCWAILTRYLIPAVLARPLSDLAELHSRWAWIRGHHMARAAIEGAAAALLAETAGQPLSTFLGGTRDRVPVGVSVGIQESPAALREVVAGYCAAGYGRIKLKIKPGKDLAYVAAVREAFPAIALMADANSAYTLADAGHLQQLDAFDLTMIEQPLSHDDIYEHSLLQRRLRTPICLDESIHSLRDAQTALALGSCGVINIKVGRVGGLLPARAIHDLCREREIPVWCGGMLETGIGRAANLAIASLPGFTLPGDISASSRYYAQDIAAPAFDLNPDSTITVPTAPGLGVTVSRETLAAVALHSQTFRP